jgi:FkbH-like protein
MADSSRRSENKQSGYTRIKCVIWDLDNTLWHGVLIEDENVSLREDVVEIIKTLDQRGILQSIASKNDYAYAMQKVEEFGLDEYFLYPQISWSSKASAVEVVARSINIGLDTVAFIDDQKFEREEVNFSHPQVLCLDPLDLDGLLDMPEMNPPTITEESKNRRSMYISDLQRNNAEKDFSGPREDFLASLKMNLIISLANESDLARIEELTRRTNQLNTTGYTYSLEELHSFIHNDLYQLMVVSLEDKFGSYGKIGLALVECQPAIWTIKLLLMSCRVMSRGVGTVMISHIMRKAVQHGVRLEAEFVPNDRNRMMYVTYKFSGFKEKSMEKEFVILDHNLSHIQPFPAYMEVRVMA